MPAVDPFLLTGVVGMFCILFAFLCNQLGRWKEDTLPYDLCNAVGGLLLVTYAWEGGAWPFVILNGIWALYSAKDVANGLLRKVRRFGQ